MLPVVGACHGKSDLYLRPRETLQMEIILFMLTSGRMRAFTKSQGVQQMRYRGAEDMPCEGSAALRDFIDYMLHEYAELDATRLFFCCDTPRTALWAMTLLEEGGYPHFSLASLSYCLPIFLRTQKLDDCWIRFEEKTWRIANGLAINDRASGKCPQVLTHRQLAEMFFYEEESGGRPNTSRQAPPTLNPLGRYVEGSKVAPKHSL